MDIDKIEQKAKQLRLTALKMIYDAGDGHPGPALSVADIVTTLFYDVMKLDPKKPDWEDRDRFILSKGHAYSVYYAALADKGYFGGGQIENFNFNLRALGSMFQGHPVMNKTPGVDMTSGSLGNGIAIGAGMAVGAKYKKKDFRTFVIVGDGEMQEGICWEGINFAAAKKLDNLYLFVDYNGWQSGGSLSEVAIEPDFARQFEAFQWDVYEIDGHNIDQIKNSIQKAGQKKGRPHVFVCKTTKGKGVSFMENDNSWHKRTPTKEEWEIAQKELGGCHGKL
jgi:transketolase